MNYRICFIHPFRRARTSAFGFSSCIADLHLLTAFVDAFPTEIYKMEKLLPLPWRKNGSEFFLKFYLNLSAFWLNFRRNARVVQINSRKKLNEFRLIQKKTLNFLNFSEFICFLFGNSLNYFVVCLKRILMKLKKKFIYIFPPTCLLELNL